MKIFKDYEIVGHRLYKFNLKEDKHLYRNRGGVPAIDKTVWEHYKELVDAIAIKTDKGRTFHISSDIFDQEKEEINHGFGAQYVVPIHRWKIESKQARLL